MIWSRSRRPLVLNRFQSRLSPVIPIQSVLSVYNWNLGGKLCQYCAITIFNVIGTEVQNYVIRDKIFNIVRGIPISKCRVNLLIFLSLRNGIGRVQIPPSPVSPSIIFSFKSGTAEILVQREIYTITPHTPYSVKNLCRYNMYNIGLLCIVCVHVVFVFLFKTNT